MRLLHVAALAFLPVLNTPCHANRCRSFPQTMALHGLVEHVSLPEVHLRFAVVPPISAQWSYDVLRSSRPVLLEQNISPFLGHVRRVAGWSPWTAWASLLLADRTYLLLGLRGFAA